MVGTLEGLVVAPRVVAWVANSVEKTVDDSADEMADKMVVLMVVLMVVEMAEKRVLYLAWT